MLADQRPDEILDRSLELLGGAAVGIGDPSGERLEHQDCIAGRVEEALEANALPKQAGILDCGSGPVGETLGKHDVVGLEATIALAADEGQDSDDPAGRDHRNRDVRAERQRPEQIAMPLISGGGIDRLRRDVGHVFRPTGPQDRCRASR